MHVAINRGREWLLVIVISLLLLEVALQGAVRLGYINISLPSYALETVTPFWQDINENFGVWHHPNAHYRHRKACIDQIYTSNSHGMRDPEAPTTSSSPRVVVLGDSFVVGFGIKDGRRVTDQLEALTGIRHLNFGTAGDFGTTQSYVLYKTLASKFDHEAVIFVLFPQNDFLDDLPARSRLRRGARYRPYLVGDYPDYKLTYPPGGLPAYHELDLRIRSALLEFSLVARAFEYASTVTQQTIASWTRRGPKTATSFYFDYTTDEFNRLRYAIEKIKEIAGERPILIVSIALSHDYAQAAASGGTPPLTRDVKALAARLDIGYIDLIEALPDSMENYLKCDFHWSERGHRRAAEAIAKWTFYRR
jgi:hypothetical protein